MRIDWWTLGLQTLNALVLLWILARFFFRPLAGIMRQRQEAAASVLKQAEAAKAAAETARKQAEDEAARLAGERAAALQKAADDAQTTRDALLADARKQADKIRADAETAAAALKEQAIADAASAAGDLAVDIAARLMARLPDAAKVSGFIDGLGEAIAGLPEATRIGIAGGGEGVHVIAPRPLTEAENKACAVMLEHVLGHSVTFTVDTDPAVIAGLELGTAHALVRNSFRADLERIRAELRHHD